jgi:ketosteroid isomerase-like protein
VSNAKTVQSIYEAFGRQDAAGILEPLTDDVAWDQWEENSAVEAGTVPYLKERHGKDGVIEWLGTLQALDLHDMQVLNILEGDNEVVASVRIEFTVKATGKRLVDEELHLWTFNDDGRVLRLRHYTDTAKHLDANRA